MDEDKPYGFIYITTNKLNYKKYIGQKTYDEKGKWVEYLGSGIHLARAIKKYGKENFSKEIIENCYSEDGLNEREIYWINYYNAIEDNEFYNIALGGDGGNTIAGYDEDKLNSLKKKLSKLRKGKVNLGANNGMAKKVICLNNMKIFNSTVEAAREYDIKNPESIQGCCNPNSRMKTAGIDKETGERLVWETYEDGKEYAYIPYVNKRLRRIILLNNGEIFQSIAEAKRKYNAKNISKCLNGERDSAGTLNGEKLKWKYLD